MAKEGKRLELYEVLAAKRARGGQLLLGGASKSLADKPSSPTPSDHPEADVGSKGNMAPSAVLIPASPLFSPEPEVQPPRPRSAREVVLALDMAFLLFVVILALSASAYFLGYKRGREERPATMSGLSEVETANQEQINLRELPPMEKATTRPPEQDYTLVLRSEPVKDGMVSRLDLELREAMEIGGRALKESVQGFIFRTAGNEPLYVLAVGLGKTSSDPGLNALLQFYNKLEAVNVSRESRPYRGCKIGQVKDLGLLVE